MGLKHDHVSRGFHLILAVKNFKITESQARFVIDNIPDRSAKLMFIDRFKLKSTKAGQ